MSSSEGGGGAGQVWTTWSKVTNWVVRNLVDGEVKKRNRAGERDRWTDGFAFGAGQWRTLGGSSTQAAAVHGRPRWGKPWRSKVTVVRTRVRTDEGISVNVRLW